MAAFTGKFVSVGTPTQATPGEEIMPEIVVGNTSSTVPCAVGVAWEGDDIDELPGESFTIVGIEGFRVNQTIYPRVRTMSESGDAHWKLNLLKINDDGVSWSKSGVSRDITIKNTGGSGDDYGDEDESFMSKYGKWFGIGAVVAGLALVVGIGVKTLKKK